MTLGELVAGRYELEELVGRGGMSAVWRAHDRLLERKVALKILDTRLEEDDEFVERFRREARAVAQLSHPNIVTVIDRGEEADGRQFIVFEYVDGDDLKQLVAARGALPIDQVIALGIEIASGLAFAHERGIVHRDVKPQNVLLNGDGRAKVTDFGIARSLDVERGVTQTGTVLGTSNYIAPEQASGQPVDDRSDVYSFGVVLFELLTGDVPFPGDNFVTVAMQHVNTPAPFVGERRPDAPPALAALVDRMLEKDHGGRPSMDEVVAELEAIRSGLASAASPAGATVVRRPVGRRRRRRSPVALVLAVLGALVLGAALALLALRDDGGGDGGEAGAAPRERVTLRATSAVDPERDGEHDDEVPNATDGNRSSYWTTQRYSHPNGEFGKPGVGLTFSASAPPGTIVVRTDTPGFRAEIRSGDEVIAPSRIVNDGTRFDLPDDAEGPFLLWITNRGPNGAVRVNEVTRG